MKRITLMGFFILTGNSFAQQAKVSFRPVLNFEQRGLSFGGNTAGQGALSQNSFQYNYYEHLGTACRVEYHIEKAAGIPLRIRVGSLESCNYLEGKPNATRP